MTTNNNNHIYGSIPLVFQEYEGEEGSTNNDFDHYYDDKTRSFVGCLLTVPSTIIVMAIILLYAFFCSPQESSEIVHRGVPRAAVKEEMLVGSATTTTDKTFHRTNHHVHYHVPGVFEERLGSSSKSAAGNKKDSEVEEWKIPHYFKDQLIDHFNPTDDGETWSNRYYVSSKYFDGPGHPIFVIIGGEGPQEDVSYPFIREDLAKKFGAYVLQTEHRFYGTSFPYRNGHSPSSDELKKYLSPDQALEDYVRIIRYIQNKIGCSLDRTSQQYCPIITVGGSYPGYLSAMMRYVYPHVVDIGYASSAPIRLYSREETNQYLYFDLVTRVAETASPGCAKAYKTALQDVYDQVSTMPIQEATQKLGICGGDKFPHYIRTPKLLATEITMMVGFSFADFNMDYYPPGDPESDLIKACDAMQAKNGKSSLQRFADYLVVKGAEEAHPGAECYDLHWVIPDGPNATITGSDWTGMGDGYVGNAWEFQCCRDLIVNAGYSHDSMFLDQSFELDWLTDH